MKISIYLLMIFFVFTSYANEDFKASRLDLSSDDIYFPFQGNQWLEFYRNEHYSLVKKSDDVISFKLIPNSDIIKDEHETYLIKTVLNPVSYVERIAEDFNEIFGITFESREKILSSLSDEFLKSSLDKYNENIDYYKKVLISRHQATTVDDLIAYSAHLYRLRNSKETRPNPFIANEYVRELYNRESILASK